jgi:hypothetical protein
MSDTTQDAIELLVAARRILELSHDIEDGGAPGEHPHQVPNWAMRATNAIDEALSESHSAPVLKAVQSEHGTRTGEK